MPNPAIHFPELFFQQVERLKDRVAGEMDNPQQDEDLIQTM